MNSLQNRFFSSAGVPAGKNQTIKQGRRGRRRYVFSVKSLLCKVTFTVAAVTLVFTPLASGGQNADETKLDWLKDHYRRGGATFRLQYAHDTKEDTGEDHWDTRMKLSGYVDFNLWKNAKMHLSAIALYGMAGTDINFRLKPEQIYRIPDEAYILQSLWRMDVSLGLQRAKWGVNQFLSPTDNINPLELRGFIDPDTEDIIIPVPMAKATFFLTDFIYLEGIYIPWFYESEFHLFRTDYALCRNQDVCPVNRDEYLEEEDIPFDDKWEAGARLHAIVGDFTLEASYFNTREDFPVFRSFLNPGGFDYTYHKYFYRYQLYGGGIGWSYKKMALRAEGVYSPERKYTVMRGVHFWNYKGFRPSLKYDTSPYYSYAVEAEYSPSRRLFLLAGYQEFKLTDAPPDLLISSETTRVGLFLFRATALRQRLELMGGLLYFIEDDDYIVAPRLAYTVNDHVELTVGANILEGPRANTNDLGGLAPVSIYSEEDEVFAGFRYDF